MKTKYGDPLRRINAQDKGRLNGLVQVSVVFFATYCKKKCVKEANSVQVCKAGKKNIAVNVDIDIDDIKESENLSVQAEKSLRSLVRRVDGCEGYLHVPWE